MSNVAVAITRLPHSAGLILPDYHSVGASGLDLLAAVNMPLELASGAWVCVPTGIAIALPTGFEAQVRPRSGLAASHGVTVLNSPGTIDADYRGEVQVVLVNHAKVPFTITRGMRIAQIVIAPVTRIHWQPVEVLSESSRGSDGFGSTGVGP